MERMRTLFDTALPNRSNCRHECDDEIPVIRPPMAELTDREAPMRDSSQKHFVSVGKG